MLRLLWASQSLLVQITYGAKEDSCLWAAALKSPCRAVKIVNPLFVGIDVSGRRNYLRGQPCLRALRGRWPVVLGLTDIHAAQDAGLGSVDNMDGGTLLPQMRIKRQPVVSSGLHAKDAFILAHRFSYKIPLHHPLDLSPLDFIWCAWVPA